MFSGCSGAGAGRDGWIHETSTEGAVTTVRTVSGSVWGGTARLVEEAGVLLVPASVYRSDLAPTPADRFRIGYGRAGIDAGLAALRAWLRRNAR